MGPSLLLRTRVGLRLGPLAPAPYATPVQTNTLTSDAHGQASTHTLFGYIGYHVSGCHGYVSSLSSEPLPRRPCAVNRSTVSTTLSTDAVSRALHSRSVDFRLSSAHTVPCLASSWSSIVAHRDNPQIRGAQPRRTRNLTGPAAESQRSDIRRDAARRDIVRSRHAHYQLGGRVCVRSRWRATWNAGTAVRSRGRIPVVGQRSCGVAEPSPTQFVAHYGPRSSTSLRHVERLTIPFTDRCDSAFRDLH